MSTNVHGLLLPLMTRCAPSSLAQSSTDDGATVAWLSDNAPWTIAPWVFAACCLSCFIYTRGWCALRAKSSATRARYGIPQIAAFFAGWVALLFAIASPLDAFAGRALTAHMVQHMVLTIVAPPLLWLGSPAMPMLFGLPRALRLEIVAPLLAAPLVRTLMRFAAHPLVGWIALTLVTLMWHVPAAYELALRDVRWHRLEHFTMLAAGLLFWLAIIEPFPYRRRWPRIAMVPYLVAADLSNTIVAASLAFSSGVIYPWYASIGLARGVDALADQKLAAGIMWVPGSVAYLVPAMVIVAARLLPRHAFGVPRDNESARPLRSLALPVLQRVTTPQSSANSKTNDFLRIPVIGAVLRSPRGRLMLRVALLIAAMLVVLDGLLGADAAPMNLAGTFPWTHWRGVAVIAILALGNVACMACPLIAPRTVLRRWIRPMRAWPVALRSKWMAVVLMVVWLVSYEAFDLWDSPFATALLILGFIAAATAVDLLFEGASFCRYVCPLGQYQMMLSTVAPREVRVLDTEVCAKCTTHDCIKGRVAINSATGKSEVHPGCGLGLFLPKKSGNLDCTFCLDCVSACPHGNIGVVTVTRGADLARASWRSGIGSLANRVDIGVLASIFTVGAIANAAGMTAPVVAAIEEARDMLATLVGMVTDIHPYYIVRDSFMQGLFVLAAIALGVAVIAWASGMLRVTQSLASDETYAQQFTRVALASVPLGASVWLVHFGFHLVTGWPTGAASIQRVLHDLSLVRELPTPILSCCVAPPSWLINAELLALSLGLSASLGVLWWSIDALTQRSATAARVSPSRITMRFLAPACVMILLWAVMAWVVFQPMEMRGTSGFAVAELPQ